MLTYLSNKSQIIPLTMATRSSAKLLHSKSYAETQKHGGGASVYYILLCKDCTPFELSFGAQRIDTSAESPFLSPRLQPGTWVGGGRAQVKAQGGDRWARRKSDTTCIFLPAQQFSCWFLLLSHVPQCVGVSWPWDGASTTTGAERWPFRKVMNKQKCLLQLRHII